MSTDVMDLHTGKIINNVVSLTTLTEEQRNSEYKQRLIKMRKLNRLIAQHCGGFFFYKYDDVLSLLENNSATSFRFVYLCACATKDGYFIKYNNELCRTQEDFVYIFDRHKDTVKKYISELEKHRLIYKEGKGYRLNPIYYYCNLQDKDLKKHSVRTFRNCIIELYNNSNPNEHSLMGELLKFIPYINIYNNVLCWYPDQPDKNLIQPLTLQEIRHIIRPNSNYGSELEDKLETIFIKGEPVLGKFEAVNEYHYIINPRLLYRGNDPKQFQSLIDQFDVAKGQCLNRQQLKKKRRKMENA